MLTHPTIPVLLVVSVFLVAYVGERFFSAKLEPVTIRFQRAYGLAFCVLIEATVVVVFVALPHRRIEAGLLALFVLSVGAGIILGKTHALRSKL